MATNTHSPLWFWNLLPSHGLGPPLVSTEHTCYLLQQQNTVSCSCREGGGGVKTEQTPRSTSCFTLCQNKSFTPQTR